MGKFLKNLLNFLLIPSTRRWLWLALSALLAGFFLTITDDIHDITNGEKETLEVIDHYILNQVTALRSPRINNMMIDVTALGSVTVLTLLVTVLSLFMFFIRRKIIFYYLVTVSLGSALITQLLKSLFERERPGLEFRLVEVEGFSYPSGHSLSSAAIYFTLAIIFCSLLKKRTHRFIIGSLFSTIVLLIGFSRIYLGVHYFSDVTAGILMGLSWASLIAAIEAILKHKYPSILEQTEIV